MTQATITKVKNNTVSLPKTWKDARVFIRVTGNTATITKVSASKTIFTKAEIKAFRKLGKKVTKPMLAKAISAGK